MKTFVSIGSGSGIGIATAERFAKAGFRVVLTSRDQTKLDVQATRLRDAGHTVETATADSGNLASIGTLVAVCEDRFGSVDVLHFDSASMHRSMTETQAADTFVPDPTIDIGAALVAMQEAARGMLARLVALQEAARGMLARRAGTMLLTGGVFGVQPNPYFLAPSIAEAGLRPLTLGLFDAFRERNVHVASVTVGMRIAAGSAESRDIAEAFWNLHAQAKEAWVAEVTYPF